VQEAVASGAEKQTSLELFLRSLFLGGLYSCQWAWQDYVQPRTILCRILTQPLLAVKFIEASRMID